MDRNELDPSVPSATEVKKIPLIIKVYAVLCILSGVGTLPSVAVFMWQVITALINGNAAAKPPVLRPHRIYRRGAFS